MHYIIFTNDGKVFEIVYTFEITRFHTEVIHNLMIIMHFQIGMTDQFLQLLELVCVYLIVTPKLIFSYKRNHIR